MSSPPEQTHDGDSPEPRYGRNERLRRRRSKRGLFERVSIQSKLMLMLLTMSVLAVAIAGGIGFQSGTQSLRASVFDRLTGVREAQSRVLQMGLNNITGSLVVLSRGDIVSSSMNAFTAGFEQLADATVTPEQDRALAAYYSTTFTRTPDSKLDISALVPTSPAARYLQTHYTVPNANRDQPAGLSDARDGSIWPATNARYDGYFTDIVKRLGFRDAFLIDAKGDVVYSASKGVELGTNVLTGPYRGEGFLPGAFQKAMASNDIDYIDTTDFSAYLPSGQPTAWIVMPIGPPGRASGVMAVEFSSTIVSDLMTGAREWERAGMGTTGETFVVGKDDLMRSDSRLFLEDPEAYKKDVIDAGTPPAVAERALKQGTTVLVQPVGTRATQLAQRGETGTLVATDYLGHRALQAYAPVTLKGLDWVIVATINSDEAFAPQRNFAQKLIRSTAFIIFVACLAAMLWSKLFVRPIRRLEDGAEKISTGDYNVQLPVDSNDEFGDLAVAFNDMSRNLAAKDELLAEQRAENDRLLTSLMPESVVERYRDGDENIAEEHQDVTVIYADLVGVDELSGGMAAEESLAVINKLVRQFDAAAQSNGVERVRNTHNGYLASCGLTVPRLDNIHRTVDFALEMQRIVNRFNAETGGDIQLRAGIDTGSVTSGLVGRAGLVYDLWGGAVHLASKMRRGQPGVYVSEDVYEATRDTRHYTQAGTVTIADREEPTWRLSEDRP